ncbi:alpha/beta fold hydrolase [Gilvimarinus sp. F26214L]|uniref:alpha/beta fold hydrolase n=1 Tax=Gilvimarinus sp. DZF01 TaxID=3461371 RepID=UPI004045B1F0
MIDRNLLTLGDGCRIAYRWDGPADKPVLVLSNSIATTLEMWDGVVEVLSGDFRILRYDTRGHGGSAATPGAYSFDRLGRDVLEMLDLLGLSRVHFCGLSLGGFIGQWLGVHAPERIDHLILCNTSPYLGPADQWDRQIEAVHKAPDLSEFAGMFLGNWFPPGMRERETELMNEFRRMVLSTDPLGLAGSFAAVRDADLRRTNALISCPTLVIAGQHDTVTLASHGTQIAETIPGAELCVLDAVHLSNIECPVEFHNAVASFLSAASARRKASRA